MFIPAYKDNFETHLEKPHEKPHEDSRITHDGEHFESGKEPKTSPGID